MTLCGNVHGNAFSRVVQKYTKFANFTLLYFRHFTIFYNQTSQFHYYKVLKIFIQHAQKVEPNIMRACLNSNF